LLCSYFTPDISAGFDAHRNDSLAGINLEAEDFAYMTKRFQEIQPNLLLGLEGGYNLGALGECVVGVCEELM
jgi:acetoin utilization deacetylase AcuC-like enzyme